MIILTNPQLDSWKRSWGIFTNADFHLSVLDLVKGERGKGDKLMQLFAKGRRILESATAGTRAVAQRYLELLSFHINKIGGLPIILASIELLANECSNLFPERSLCPMSSM